MGKLVTVRRLILKPKQYSIFKLENCSALLLNPVNDKGMALLGSMSVARESTRLYTGNIQNTKGGKVDRF